MDLPYQGPLYKIQCAATRLPSKETIKEADVLSIHMIPLGVPAILQADIGGEFKGAVLQLVKNYG